MPLCLENRPELKRENAKKNVLEQQAHRLSGLRREHKLSQAKLAEVLDVSLPTYQAYEKGERDVPFSTVHALSQLYELSTDQLMLYDEPSTGEAHLRPVSEINVPLVRTTINDIGQIKLMSDLYSIPREVDEKHPDSFLYEVMDNSVNRVVLRGAYVLIEPSEYSDEDSLYLVYMNNEVADHTNMLCKIKTDPKDDSIILAPDSTEGRWPELKVNSSSMFHVIGKAVWYTWPYDKKLTA